ncbi:serine hydrolase [Neobacillus soli]|uniref:serine hydrolase n=1 Tax=Neobacillus soli TaxID=220688 RepID=UPI000B06A9BF
MRAGRFLKGILIVIILCSMVVPAKNASAAALTAHQDFSKKVSAELTKYIKKSGGTVTLQYQDLGTGDVFQIKGKTAGRAASTIKLPLALYIMEQASKGKINLNQKLVYKSRHYSGGSGVIQNQKVGTSYTIRDLVKKAMIYSDNIAFIMLKERVGQANLVKYIKSIGGQYAYPNGQNLTSANDLTIYAKKLYQFSKKSPLGEELVGYLKKTVYNTTIPKGIKGVAVAHKVGMIPAERIYNDAAIVYDKKPFVLAIMTKNLSYEKSQKVIADLAAIVYKQHKAKGITQKVIIKGDTKIYLNSWGEIAYAKVYSGSKLIKIQEFYPNSTIENASQHINYIYDINNDGFIAKAAKLDKETQKATNRYEYYSKTVYGKHGGNIKYIFDLNAAGYITKAVKTEKGTKRTLAWYQYQSNTVYGKHSSRISGITLNVPLINQRPELPTGCEITAVTMMLQYKGVRVNKVTLANKMPRHSSNPNLGYVGNPFTKRGWTIYPPALMGVVKKYAGSAKNLTGTSNANVEKQLLNNKPIVVLVSRMHGFSVHALTLTGFDKTNYYYNDCWSGEKNAKISKKEFNKLWSNQSKRAISY